MQIAGSRSRTRIAAVSLAAAGGLLLAGCAGSGPVGGDAGDVAADRASLSGTASGAGATSAQVAMQTWIAGFTADHADASIAYQPIGSGAGLDQFADGKVDFAASDESFSGAALAKANARCGGEIVQVPLYVSPIAVVHNLRGVDGLQLAPATLAGIFDRKITSWNAPEIAADNPGKALPQQPITTVSRSDRSGTTQNFAEYLKAAAGFAAWPHEVNDTWPVQGGVAGDGTSGVVQGVSTRDGAIGYADASQAGSLGTAKIKVGNEYVGPSTDAAAKVLESSKRADGQGRYSFSFTLARDTTASGTYPVVLVSYGIACAKYPNFAKAELVKGVFTYLASAQGQEAAAKASGSAPLSEALRAQITPAVEAISAGSPS
ncbi:MAG TPA: phosphate ABC transporter substrate-binding protein PstS [Pseudonocardia sp.]|uniref:phosphate ABC transporter substrate-binding protein PstS n=1 Tax=Pseudonocardia sp. TaxID=60912 RepID=UPI002BC85299|nr:phosphate ABC transporter substrate-binding protein PstS [Pseudonocardia sp.]HTF55108.1 phosphate ABC transporter substrate-binding protein PstS [Pseudonocardia sp.]